MIDGNKIKVTVLGHNEFGEVKIGIDAPPHVKISREELVGDRGHAE